MDLNNVIEVKQIKENIKNLLIKQGLKYVPSKKATK